MYLRIKDLIGGRLRVLCDGLSPRQRTVAVIVAAALFALGNLYMIVSAVYGIGRVDIQMEGVGTEPAGVPDIVPADTLSDERIREMEEFFNQFNR